MSIDQQSRSATNPSETEAQRQAGSNESAKKRAIDLSPSQVLGGALAAMTAAAIGSRLGAAGTIIGAAAASVVAAVAGAVYTASLRHTHAKVRTVWSGRWSSGLPATVEVIGDRADSTAANAGPQHTAPRRAPLFPGRWRIPWKPAAVGALLAFGIAAATLTGLELISGHALSGGEGTTVTQVTRQDTGSKPAKPDPETEAKEKTPASSSEPTQSPEPSTSPSSSPEETTPTPDPEPTTTPVPTAGPSSSAPPSPPSSSGTPPG
jgi:hypothetical protein